MTGKQVEDFADRLLARLEQWHREEHRGPLAKLRRGLSETTRHEAWLVLGRLFGPIAVDHPVFSTVAACFALHPSAKRPKVGNFGETMRRCMPADKMRDEKEPHARFRRLLACDTQQEICRQIPHAVRLAKSRKEPVAVDYRRLFADLWWWGERTKVAWAKAYWRVPAEPEASNLAKVGVPVGEEEEAIMPEP